MCNIGTELFQDAMKRNKKQQKEKGYVGQKPNQPQPPTPQNGIGGSKK